MSMYWGYHCTGCDVFSETWFNHGEHILRSCAKNWQHIQQLQDNDESGYLEVHIMAHDYCTSGVWAFLREHMPHGLELANEYGETEPLDTAEVRPEIVERAERMMDEYKGDIDYLKDR